MKKLRFCIIISFIFSIAFLNGTESQAKSASNFRYTWENTDLGYKFIDEKGYYVTNGWKWVPLLDKNGSYNGEFNWKFFNSNGLNVNQFYTEGGKTWISLSGPFKEYHKGWWKDPQNDQVYYFRTQSGSRVSGWQYIDAGWKYFRDSGTQAFGWQYIQGNWYYLDLSNGNRTTGWRYINNSWKYFDNEGKSVNSLYNESGYTYLSLSGPNSGYIKGWWTNPNNGHKYYFRQNSGSMVNGWQFIDGGWKYFRNSGTQAFGWQYIQGNWYYLNSSSGNKAFGWQYIDNQWYYLNPNTGVKEFGEKLIDGNWHYLDPTTGVRQSGWVLVNGKQKFYDENGIYDDKKSIYPMSAGSDSLYSISHFEWHGIINWQGKKFSYYSERVLPGPGLNIPGRHTANGFVRDKDGYIVLASDYYPKGTIVSTPFGADGKVYDRFGVGEPAHRFDVYTR